MNTQHSQKKKVKNQVLTDTKGKVNGNAIIVGDFNTTLTSIGIFSRQKINETTEILNDTIEQLDLIDSYRTLHPKKPIIYILYKYPCNILG